MTAFQFDASRVPPAEARQVVPKDWYTSVVTATEVKATSNNAGAYLNVELTIADGPYKGLKLFGRHNIQNQNPQAVEIGYREISALCHAVGVMQVSDTQQLHGRPLEVRVGIRPAEGQYEETNEVKAYRACGSGKTPAGNGVGGSVGAAPSFGAPAAAPAPAWGQPNTATPAAPPAWNGVAPAQQPTAAPASAPPPWQQPAPQQPVAAPAAAQNGSVPPWQQGAPAAAAPVPAQAQTVPVPSAPQQGNVPPWMQQR